jgi:STAM-binding protein
MSAYHRSHCYSDFYILSYVEKAPKHAHVLLIPVFDSDLRLCDHPSASRVLQEYI